jgi:tetratricopeptide (TPR) repeat protein
MTKDSDIQSLFKRAGKNLSAIDQIANHLQQRRLPLEHALEAYEKFLVDSPDSVNAVFNYAYYLSKDGQFEAAVNMYQRALKLGIDTPEEVHLNIANIYMDHLHNSEKAKAHLQQALNLNPGYASAYYNLGNLSETEGNRDEACRCFERCLKLDPANESALARLADAHIFVDEGDPLLARLTEVARNSRNSDVHFAIGRAYEKLALFERAWQHFSTANQLDKPALPPYRRAITEAIFHRIKSQCSYQWLSRFAGLSDETVFICGMFRSGSTLLEQILAAHPRFIAGGESEFFPRLVAKAFGKYPEGLDRLTTEKAQSWKAQHAKQSRKLFGDSIRITDKRPDNFLHIGLIKAVLPSAKFVVTERDWRDVATSVYSTRLGPGQSYATSLIDIRHYIDLQSELVDHWQSILGPDLIRIRYEDLVSEPRDTITRLLECLGEDWNEGCLSFNKLKNTVQTASVWQVREPLHTNSIGRWRNYEQHFENAFGVDAGS